MAAGIDVSDGAQLWLLAQPQDSFFRERSVLLANHVPQSQLSEISGFGWRVVRIRLLACIFIIFSHFLSLFRLYNV